MKRRGETAPDSNRIGSFPSPFRVGYLQSFRCPGTTKKGSPKSSCSQRASARSPSELFRCGKQRRARRRSEGPGQAPSAGNHARGPPAPLPAAFPPGTAVIFLFLNYLSKLLIKKNRNRLDQNKFQFFCTLGTLGAAGGRAGTRGRGRGLCWALWERSPGSPSPAASPCPCPGGCGTPGVRPPQPSRGWPSAITGALANLFVVLLSTPPRAGPL